MLESARKKLKVANMHGRVFVPIPLADRSERERETVHSLIREREGNRQRFYLPSDLMIIFSLSVSAQSYWSERVTFT